MTIKEAIPIWPSGIARFTDGILEVTTGDGIRVAATDIVQIVVEPPPAGRLSLALVYRAGLNRVKTSRWVQPEHEATLRQLVDADLGDRMTFIEHHRDRGMLNAGGYFDGRAPRRSWRRADHATQAGGGLLVERTPSNDEDEETLTRMFVTLGHAHVADVAGEGLAATGGNAAKLTAAGGGGPASRSPRTRSRVRAMAPGRAGRAGFVLLWGGGVGFTLGERAGWVMTVHPGAGDPCPHARANRAAPLPDRRPRTAHRADRRHPSPQRQPRRVTDPNPKDQKLNMTRIGNLIATRRRCRPRR
jgi:hypothetical protein